MGEEKGKQTREFKRRLYNFTLRLIRFIDHLPTDNVSRRVGDQLLRSGTSVIGNYVEGQAASSRKDLKNYFNHSLKSSNESRLWLAILRDTGRAKANDVNPLLGELTEFSKIFGSSILTLKGKRRR